MRHIAAWAFTSVIAVVAAGCVADVETSGEAGHPAPELEEQQLGEFSPRVFRFVIQVSDDGHDPGGGWQTAFAVLKFPSVQKGLQCTVRVGMPIRSAARGRISKDMAAALSAQIATDSSKVLRALNKQWIGEDFCIAWRKGMYTLFRDVYGIPATVNQS